MTQFVTAVVTALVMLSGFMIYKRDEDMRRSQKDAITRAEKSEAELKTAKEEIERLKEANRKRMPYRSLEHLLDAMAALDAEEREVEIKRVFLNNAKSHVVQAMTEGTKREET